MLLALDQGTTSSRAIVFDDNLLIQASAQKEFQQYYPQSGWVEHDPEEIWNTQYEVACEAIEKAGVPPVQIQSIGITNQRETILLWNRQDGKASTQRHRLAGQKDKRNLPKTSRRWP